MIDLVGLTVEIQPWWNIPQFCFVLFFLPSADLLVYHAFIRKKNNLSFPRIFYDFDNLNPRFTEKKKMHL